MPVIAKLCTLLILLAQDAPTPTAPPPPTPPGEQPAAVVPDGSGSLSKDATVDQTLQALHHRGQDLHNFTADVTLATSNLSLGDSSSQKGTVVYQLKSDGTEGGDARIRVTFNTKTEGKKIFDQKQEYLLDNGWLTDRDYDRKTEIRRQVLRPGEKLNLLKLGEGPFPLPVGQTPEAVRKLFEVTKVPPTGKKDDLPNLIHIRLKPRDDTQFARKFFSIDIYVDPKTEMPKRIVTVNPNQSEKRTTDLEIKSINSKIDDSAFTLDPLPPEGWNRQESKYTD